MMKNGVLIVIYNRNGADSPSCEALASEAADKTVVLVDNSTADQGNAAYCERAGFLHLPQGGNVGLAAAYNAGIAKLRACGVTHVTLLDDDTVLPEDYFEKLTAAVQSRPEVGIWLPVVSDERGILSPCRISGTSVRRMRPGESLPQAHLTGINSGMTIVLSAIGDYRYDEAYFLDYIDHAFLRDMKARGVSVGTFPAMLRQRFSDNMQDAEAAARRYRSFAKDYTRFCGGRVKAAPGLLKRRLALKVKH